MGTQVNRIEKEFLLKTFLDRKIPITVHGDKKQAGMLITQYTDSDITLAGDSQTAFQFKKNEPVRLFISIDNTFFTLSSRIMDSKEKILVIENSSNFCKNPERKYERINTRNMKVSFSLKGETIELNFPKTDTFAIIEEPPKSDEFDVSSIAGLTRSFKDHMGQIAGEHNIIMFRENPPARFEETLITRIGKIFWIPNTEGELPQDDSRLSTLVVTYNELSRFLEYSGTSSSLVRSEIAAMLYKKSKSNIFAEIFCPILYHEYAIGYIYAALHKRDPKAFNVDLVHYVYQFSKVLSYSLEKHGYFKQEAGTVTKYQEPIIDLSAAGLLFASQSEDLDHRLTLLDDIDISITIDEKKIIIGSRVMRKFNDYSTYYFALQFLRISDTDFRFIFEYLYGRSFTKNDEMRWEGGSPPPPV
jgi:hypothetical protein